MRQTAIAPGGGLRALSAAERGRFEANVHAWPAISAIVADWEARLRDGRLLMTWTHRSNAIDDDGFGTGSRAILSDDELTFDFDSDYIVISAESDDYCATSGDTPWCCAPEKGGCNCFAGYGNTVQLPNGDLVTATFKVLVNGSSFSSHNHQFQTVVTRWQLPPRSPVSNGTNAALKSDDGAGLSLPTPGDPDGSRASALQQAVSTAAPNAELHLSGTYNFSTSSFVVAGKVGLTLSSKSAPAMFVFQYRSDVLPHDMQTSGALHPGVNISHSQRVTLRFAAIDYLPKARVLFCQNPRAGCGEGVGPSGPGITIHMFNSSDCLIEDVAVHAAP